MTIIRHNILKNVLTAAIFALSFLTHISAFVVPMVSSGAVLLNSFVVHKSELSTVLLSATSSSSTGAPAVLDKPTTKTPKKTSENVSSSKTPSNGWAVRLYNDPMNKREFVARCLSEICGLDDGAAFQIMMSAHQNGKSVIGNYAFEMAEFYRASLAGEGLTVDMISLDDE